MQASADLSIVHLIAQASIPVQAVMLLLVLMSLWSWWLIFYKGSLIKQAKRRIRAFDDAFWSGSDLTALYQRVRDGQADAIAGAQAEVFVAGFREFVKQKRQANATKEAIVDGTRRALKVAVEREMDRLEHRLPGLATVASVAPYIGLLGTVWGIMNSFRGLASVGQATLAQVAPGIAEALIATAIGLFAAIPAVVAYNRYQAELDRINTQLETFAEEFLNILQRQA
ncbi:MAG: protein TolQ [Casimicrobiaceae bacterium]|nr:protein TolQ [Casimicrobiaceae bacterium]MCX8099283.1 protein TolQ [Casimicrobiaceae bacterium]MDW8313028.1 protein TolQ [Burkholderiales bacterium]